MDTNETTEGDVNTTNGEGDAGSAEIETLSIPKKDYETLNQTLGSLKKELKDLKKSQSDSKETSKTNTPDQSGLLQKSYLRAAGITAPDEVELALSTAKKWGMEVDTLVDDEDFTAKLEKVRTAKTNATATSNIKGGVGSQQAKNTPEYWIAKGTPPSAQDVPDRKSRAKIARAMMKNASTSGKVFYND